jgi:MtN3 and saliva related transmembrane protein
MQTLTTIIGFAATVVGTVLMLPQVIRSWRTRQVDDLSLSMVLLYVLNCALWLVYGCLVAAPPVIVANSAGLMISIVQLVLKIRYAASGV